MTFDLLAVEHLTLMLLPAVGGVWALADIRRRREWWWGR